MDFHGFEIVENPRVPKGVAVLVGNRRQALAEAYGMGDVQVGLKITGAYPNAPAITTIKLKD